MSTSDDVPGGSRESGKKRIERWRREQLEQAGYPLPMAVEIAESGADLHLAAQLIERAGYTPKAAVRIATTPEVDLNLAVRLRERGCQQEVALGILL